MSYQEFYSALTPYNYSAPKNMTAYFEQYKDYVGEIMYLADIDKNGQLSFTEFFFFVLICQTASKIIKNDFKKTGGKMNAK